MSVPALPAGWLRWALLAGATMLLGLAALILAGSFALLYIAAQAAPAEYSPLIVVGGVPLTLVAASLPGGLGLMLYAMSHVVRVTADLDGVDGEGLEGAPVAAPPAYTTSRRYSG